MATWATRILYLWMIPSGHPSLKNLVSVQTSPRSSTWLACLWGSKGALLHSQIYQRTDNRSQDTKSSDYAQLPKAEISTEYLRRLSSLFWPYMTKRVIVACAGHDFYKC
ncbi:hypothetical protein ACHAWO_005810 [Cyclotella atomus]|uniref:Secreted protein n=1 Tax=Cyclotella atomus TaxID=382360 RepID=A0ABD3P2M5_9STRA